MFRLFKYLKKYKKEVIIGPILKLIEAIFELIVPLVMAKIIDVGIKNGDKVYVYKMGGVMILLGVAGLTFALTCQYFASRASQGFGTELRNKLFSHINKLSHSEIDKIGTPSLITRMTADINQTQNTVAMLIRLATRAPFLAIGSLVMALSLDIKLSLVFVIVFPVITLALYFIMSRSIPFFRAIQKKLDRVSLITRENLTGARVVRALAKEKSEIERFNTASEDLADTAVSVGKISALLNPITFVVMNLGITAILWLGANRIDKGSLFQGQVIAFVNYMTQLSFALIALAYLIDLFTKAAASADRINEVLDMETSVKELNSEEVKGNSREDTPIIEFRDTAFSYSDSEEKSLQQFSLKIWKGETVGIIGGTGAGKSTLINLLPRFYDVDQGNVLIEGIDVKQYPLKQLRNMIGIVPQKAVLFAGSIRDNMRWRDKSATDEEIDKALEIAQAKEFVYKGTEGLDKRINQGGKNLSGGQKQRLTIAKALIGNPKILILDDSSSALDYATDAALRKAIKEELRDTTVIIVSQRATSIKYADKIVVMDDGCVVAVGKHEDLINSCEIYSEICSSQTQTKAEQQRKQTDTTLNGNKEVLV